MANTHEQKFLNALRDIFVGAKIEGESGYINLMRIKSRYYAEGVFPHLMEKISEELAPFPNFREELFDKLYSFFKRYFSESGSIYFRHTPYYQDIFERIYTDDRDVMLFWKTQNLYYVKTDRLFRSLTLSLDDAPDQKYLFDASAVAKQSFSFDASTLQNKRNNEKRSLIFEYKGIGENEMLKFAVQYSQGATKTKIDDILKAIKKDGVKVNEDQLTRAFRLFERQSEVDFFINKNAKAFLNEQFDLWMYQYLFKRESDFNEKRIKEMQALKRVAYAIIEFISQFEDELVRIWNKPKFTLASNYVITFDRVFGKSEIIARKLLAHEGITAQIAEWRELGMIDDSFTAERIFEKDEEEKPKAKKKKANSENGSLFDEETSETETKLETVEDADSLPMLSNKYRYLPFDTRHFKSLEIEILSLFDNLDEELDGRLIHSENYQTLNTLKDKFREKVNFIFIDPPYNTAATEIIYENEYKRSSWLSLMENRLKIAKDFLLPTNGILCATIDDNEVNNLSILLNSIFTDYEVSPVIIEYNFRGRMKNNFAVTHEYGLYVIKQGLDLITRLSEISEDIKRNLRRTGIGSTRGDVPKQFYGIEVDKKTLKIVSVGESLKIDEAIPPNTNPETEIIYPIDSDGLERRWYYSRKRVLDEAEAGIVWAKRIKGEIQIHYFQEGKEKRRKTVWTGAELDGSTFGSELLNSLFVSTDFSFPKSIYAVKRCIESATNDKSALIFDFFGGSGTTAHAVINLNREDGGKRKYILVEANDYFHTVILPRVKKVVFSDKWNDGKAREDGKGISHFCKYFALEQYEDTLRRAVYLNDRETETPSFFDNPYESPFASYVFLRDKKMSDALKVDYANNKISVDFAKLYEDIDLAETLSCIKGKFIKSLTATSVTFADGETINYNELDYRDILPLIWWDK